MDKLVRNFYSRSLNVIKGKLFKGLSIYTLLGFINKVFPLVLLPFLTRVLTPSDYGIIAMFATVRTFFNPFTNFGTASSLERYYFDKKEINYKDYLSNVFFIIITCTFFFGAIFLLFKNEISSLSGVPKSFLWIVVVVSFGSIINRINLIIYRVKFKSISFSILNIVESSLYPILMIIFALGFKLGWRADVYSQLIVYSSLGVWGTYILIKNDLLDLKIALNKDYIKKALSFGLPMFIHTFGIFFVNMSDKLLINNFLGLEKTGIYNIGFKVATMVLFFVTAFNNAYTPWLYSKLKLKTKSSIKKAYLSSYYSILFVVFLGVTLLIFLPFLYPILVGEKFQTSINISKIIIIAQIFNAFYLLLMGYILFEKKTKYIMYITLSTSIVSVGLNFYLIPIYGIVGAANALLVVYFLKFLLTLMFVLIINKNRRIIINT